MGAFRMPSLGADMDVGTIVEWLVKVGDTVRRGQIVAVVDTAKAAIEIEAFEDGVIEAIVVAVGSEVPVGTVLAQIGPAPGAESVPASPPGREASAGPPEPAVAAGQPEPAVAAGQPGRGVPAGTGDAGTLPGLPTGPVAAGLPPEGGAGADRARPRATPPVRHLAQQLGVDLDSIGGGRVTHEDVLRAASGRLVPPGAGLATTPTGQPPSGATGAKPPSGAVGAKPPSGPTTGPLPSEASAALPAPDVTAGHPPAAAGRLLATPRARRLAAERGIDLAGISGSGSAGAVIGSDVAMRLERSQAPASIAGAGVPQASGGPGEGAARAPASRSGGEGTRRPADRADGRTQPQRREAMRTAIATLMSRSNAEIPHFHVSRTVDLGPALRWLGERNAELPTARRLIPAVLFLRASVLAAQAVPDLNGHWLSGGLVRSDRVDLGVAVATRGGGLVTPAIPDAGGLGVAELMARLADLVSRARRGALRQAEMAGASITVSNLGEAGADALFGVIFPPQVALVCVGGIIERPWAVAGMLTVRPTATIVLAADHRATDGRAASAFLARMADVLAHPEEL